MNDRGEETQITFLQGLVILLATLFSLWPEDMADLVFHILGIK